MIAKELTELPSQTRLIFEQWGLDSEGIFAKNLFLHWHEVKQAKIIFVTSFAISEQLRVLGYNGKVVDLELEGRNLGLNLMDPQLENRRNFEAELAKYLLVAFITFRGLGLIQKYKNIKTLAPKNETLIQKSIDIAQTSNNSILIYGDIVAPQKSLFENYIDQCLKFRHDGSVFSLDSKIDPGLTRFLIPAHATLWPAKVYLSKAWSDFLLAIEHREITMISPPLHIDKGQNAEAYLASINSTIFNVIE